MLTWNSFEPYGRTAEIKANKAFQSLFHLKYKNIYSSNFDKINVATATRLFSHKTAAALELNVELKTISEGALTTAYFVRLIQDRFDIVCARIRKRSITKRIRREIEFS